MIDRTERQILGINKWIQNGCRGSLEWCTGAGKTNAALMAIERFFSKNPQKKVLVIVPTEPLKQQWIKLLAARGLIFNVEVLIINTAVMQKRNVDFLVLDELHRMASDTFFKIFTVCSPSMILGLTATFERLDGKHVLLNQHCPVIDTITVKEATENGWVSPYKEYKVMIDVDLEDYYVAHNEFMNHFAFFDYKFDVAMACVAGIKKANRIVKNSRECIRTYAKFIQPDPKFEKQIMAETSAHAFAWNRALKARKEFVMNHPKKIEIAELILEHRPDSKAITFNSTIKQCEQFKTGYIVHSGNTKKKNRLTLEEFADLDIGVIHNSKSLVEGLDCKGLNLAIILHNTSSPTERIQKIGYVRPTLKFLNIGEG